MDENVLLAVVVVVVIGFVLLRKNKATVSTVSEQVAIQPNLANGESGVARYLQKQQAASGVGALSGVEKYLQEKEALAVQEAESSAVSRVAQYLESKEQSAPVSRVSKYVARKSINDKKIAKENISGVAKYLNRRG